MRKMVFCFAIVTSLSMSACATTGLNSRTGFAVVSLQKEAVVATDGKGGSKRGEACTQNILGIAALGDGTVEAAKRDGHITSVTSVDVNFSNYLGVYGSACTVVHGN